MARELAERGPAEAAAEAAEAEIAAAEIAEMNDRVCPALMDELLDSNIGRRLAEAGPVSARVDEIMASRETGQSDRQTASYSVRHPLRTRAAIRACSG
jgi:hypothetical protein